MNTNHTPTDYKTLNITDEECFDLGTSEEEIRNSIHKHAAETMKLIQELLEHEYHLRTIPHVVEKKTSMKARKIYIALLNQLIEQISENVNSNSFNLPPSLKD